MPTNPALILCAALLAAPAAVFSAGPGTTAANFLKIPVGARETALGGAFTAVADGPGTVFYNPAGLGLLEATEISYSFNDYLPGISQHWLAAARPGRNGGWGLGVNYLNIEPFPSYDSADNRTGTVSAYDMAAYLGYGGGFGTGLGLAPYARWGASAKYVSQKLDSSGADGYGADAGLMIMTRARNLRLGFGAENIVSSKIEFGSGGARLPRKFKAGASYKAGLPHGAASALLSLDFNFPDDGPRYVTAGMETTLYGLLAFRAGYSSFGDISNGLSFGLGLAMPSRAGRRLRLDYSYGSTYDLGNTHRFGISCKFGSPRAASDLPAPKTPEELRREASIEFSRQLELLYGDDPEKSSEAAAVLAGLNDSRAMEHFLALLSSGKEDWRLAALRGLSLSGDARAQEALGGALRDQDPQFRLQAVLAVGKRGGPDSAAMLMEALKSEDTEEVKSAIIEALGKINSAGGAPAR